jgi:DNA-binding NarL/FixJ family response regulator
MTNTNEPGLATNHGVGEAAFCPVDVILVDDSVHLRDRVAARLAEVRGGGAIRQAADVPSGLRLLEAREPEVLILDIEMPGEGGIDLLKIARKRACASLVIMLSIHDHPKLRQRCMDWGADFYFNKLTEFEEAAKVCHDLVTWRWQSSGRE